MRPIGLYAWEAYRPTCMGGISIGGISIFCSSVGLKCGLLKDASAAAYVLSHSRFPSRISPIVPPHTIEQ